VEEIYAAGEVHNLWTDGPNCFMSFKRLCWTQFAVIVEMDRLYTSRRISLGRGNAEQVRSLVAEVVLDVSQSRNAPEKRALQ
jgi:hypothetical protein